MTTPTPHSSFPGASWPAVPAPPAAALLSILGQLEQSQYLPDEEIWDRRLPQLLSLMKHAETHSAFWKRRFKKAGLDEAGRTKASKSQYDWDEHWQKLPILTRSEVQESSNQLVLKTLPQGHGKTSEIVTSGTSGMPVRIVRSTLDFLYWQAFQLREHVWRERDFSKTFLSILRDDKRAPNTEGVHLRKLDNWGTPVATVWETGPSVLLDYRAPMNALINAIQDVSPSYLCTFPSLLLEILRHARDEGIKMPSVQEVIVVSEASPPELEGLCREIFDAQLTSTYSAAECGQIALQCPEENRWHIQSERSVVEILDDDGLPCLPGKTGRVILTPLHNFAMPLFRYEIGDLATPGVVPCSCGRTLPLIDEIPGRARDLLLLPSGEKRPPYYGHNAVMSVRSIRQHQVVQTGPTTIVFRLVVSQPLTAEEETHILTEASNALGTEFTIELSYVDHIKRKESGKFAEFERTFTAPKTQAIGDAVAQSERTQPSS